MNFKKMKTATKIFLAVIGALLIAAGVLCLVNPFGAISSVAVAVGVVLIVSGVATAIYYFAFGSFLVLAFPVLLNAIADILFGAIFLQHPDGTSRVFIVLYGLLLMAVGIMIAVIGLIARRFVENKGIVTGAIVCGIIAFVLGIVALSSENAGAALLAIPVGVGLLALGAGYIALDVRLIKADKSGEKVTYFKDVDGDVVDVEFEDVDD